MKKSPVLHPFLFALFPVLFLYSFNITQVPTRQVIVSLLVVQLITLLLWVGFSRLYKNRKKGGLLLILMLFLFFTYGHFNKALTGAGVALGQQRYLLLLWAVLLAGGTYLISKTRASLQHHTLILNVVTGVLAASSLLQIVPYEIERISTQQTVAQARQVARIDFDPAQVQLNLPNPPPDIYYLVFDRYANPTVLRTDFGYDNRPFIDFLTRHNFFVAQESNANYPSTFLSLASSLNMEHLDYLKTAKDSNDHTVIYPMLQDFRVWRILKAHGYRFIHFGDWWDPTRTNPFADLNINYNPLGTNGFSILLLKTTALNPLLEAYWGSDHAQNRQRIWYKFDKLAEMPALKGPKFVFAHMLLPHDPYIFGPNGEPLSPAETARRSEVENYTNQLTFTNRQIRQLVETLLAQSEPPPIIIIQSDEGPMITPQFLDQEFIVNTDWSRISPDQLDTHLKIMNAYHLPGAAPDLLYDSITPVNSFRLIFNHYFGTNFELLEDKTYISTGNNLPYNFIEADAIQAQD